MAVANVGDGEDVYHDEQWLFTGEALARSRAVAHEKAERTLRSCSFVNVIAAAAAAAGRDAAGAALPPISLADGERLVVFFARLVPELCTMAGAPTEVCWTAVIFYRRFFAVRSPLEYESAAVMFACVHIACKIEEYHEITLDKLLEAADLRKEGLMKKKVHHLELSVLEGIGFNLFIEPKPDSSITMLLDDLEDRAPSVFQQDMLLSRKMRRGSEKLAIEAAVRTNVVLRWPASVIILAALVEHIENELNLAPPDSALLVAELNSLLIAGVEDSQQAAMQHMMECVRIQVKQAAAAVALDGGGQPQEDPETENAAQRARRCNRTFDALREENRERHEGHRLERKRRWREMKNSHGYQSIRSVATPQLQLSQGMADMSMRLAEADDDMMGQSWT